MTDVKGGQQSLTSKSCSRYRQINLTVDSPALTRGIAQMVERSKIRGETTIQLSLTKN